MADIVFNIAKGRVVEYYNRVENNDPSAAQLQIVAIKTAGIESDATLQDYDDLATLLAAANDEATNSGYARKLLTSVELASLPAPDDTNNRYDIALPPQTWTAVAAAGGAWSKLLVCYDPNEAGGTDSEVIPLTGHDFAVTPDGSDILANITTFFRAS